MRPPAIYIYVTGYSYSPLDLVSNINYNEGKQATFAYNKAGELVRMDDWTGTNTFELDLLGQVKKATDHKGNVVLYTYDALNRLTGSTRSTAGYPDGNQSHSYTYDTLGNLIREVGPTNKDVDTYNDLNQLVHLEKDKWKVHSSWTEGTGLF